MTAVDLIWIVPSMVVLLLLKGFFSGSEIALVNADRIRLSHAAKQGNRGARLVIELFRRPERVLTTTLVGTNIATVTLTTLGTLLMIHFFGNARGDLLAFLVYTPIFLVLGEIVPKAVFQDKADEIAPVVVLPLRFFSLVFFPVVLVFSSVARFAARRVGRPDAAEGLFVVRRQLRAVLDMAERAPDSQVFDRYRIERAIRFADLTVGETMVPSGEMVAIERQSSLPDAVRVVQRTGHGHLPVYEGNVSNVIGTVSLTPWDLLDPTFEERSMRDLMRPAAYVSRHQALEEIAPLLRERDDRMAVVVDEFGSAVGLITLGDLIASVVGEVEVGYRFEESLAREQQRIEMLEDGSYRVDGRLSISEANDVLGLDLPSIEFHTVGGFIVSRLRRLARPGDVVRVGGYRFVVDEATERAVRRVRVELDDSTATTAD